MASSKMLADFVVPHPHYRVFHGNPAADSLHATHNDQFPSALCPRHMENASTDLHLREFAQLEVQVKALQLQIAQHANPSAMSDAMAGSMAECFLFYSRLFTVESFPWPDFLAAVFTKLAEHFVTSNHVVVRSAILRVFQRAKAHVAQVNDASKLLGHLMGPLTQATSATTRTLTLQLLATMPSLLVHDTKLQQQLLTALCASDHDEQSAAAEAVSGILPLSCSFRKDVLTWSLEKDATLCCLLPGAVSNSTEAQQAWTHYAEMYEHLGDDKSAVASIRAMTTLTAVYPGDLLPLHGQLLHHVLDHDPRALVRNFVLLVTQQLVDRSEADEDDQLTDVLEGMFARINSLHITPGRGMMRLKLSALLLLEKWCINHELSDTAHTLLKDVNDLLATTTDERFGKAYVAVVSNIARQKLSSAGAVSPERSVDELLLLLHPRAAVAAKSTWNHASNALAQLCQDYAQVLAAYVAPRLIELLSILADNLDPTTHKLRRTSVFVLLGAQRRPPNVSVIQKELPTLLKEILTLDQTDARHLRAVATTFFLWTQSMTLEDTSTSKTIAEFEQQLANPERYESHADRYEMAKLAMLQGRFSLALQLMEPIVAKTDSECFGGWVRALQTLCEAESRIVSDQSVHLESLNSLARTSTYLHAAQTASFRFDLQVHFVSLHLEWVQLLQSAQQLAGEAAFINSAGHPVGREGQLSHHLRALARKFRVLRSFLLGANQRDLDTLQAHAKSCLLLASAVEGFLLLHSPSSIDLSVEWNSNADSSQCNLDMMETLSEAIRTKLDRIAKLPPSRQPGVGARVLQQLLAALCSIPVALPRLFFRSRLRSEHRLLSSAQFLTYAENTAFTVKPRSRSQLGVSLGTDFASVLKGVLALSRTTRSYWSERVEAIKVEILVCLASSSVTASSSIYEVEDASQEEKFVQHRAIVKLPISWNQVTESIANDDSNDQTMLYVPFKTPVHVKATNLATKGSYVLMAKLALVDRQGETWPLAATGCQRGIIVY